MLFSDQILDFHFLGMLDYFNDVATRETKVIDQEPDLVTSAFETFTLKYLNTWNKFHHLPDNFNKSEIKVLLQFPFTIPASYIPHNPLQYNYHQVSIFGSLTTAAAHTASIGKYFTNPLGRKIFIFSGGESFGVICIVPLSAGWYFSWSLVLVLHNILFVSRTSFKISNKNLATWMVKQRGEFLQVFNSENKWAEQIYLA